MARPLTALHGDISGFHLGQYYENAQERKCPLFVLSFCRLELSSLHLAVCMGDRSRHRGDRSQRHIIGDWDPAGFLAPAWVTMLDADTWRCIQGGQPLTLALPCVGIDACSQALVDMKVPFLVKYAYAIQVSLARPLTALHGDISGFHLGQIDGNLLSADVHAWDRVDGIVAGPPCPPWSNSGKHGSWADTRSQVFWKVNDIIVDQGHKGALFFILEMVTGIDAMHSGGDRPRHHPDGDRPRQQTPLAEWLSDLSARAPMWEVHVWHMDTADYLPQHRERLYTVGVNKNTACISPHRPRRPDSDQRITLSDILHPGIPQNQEQDLPARLRWNLFAAKMRFEERMRRMPETVHGSGIGRGSRTLATEIDRSPDGTWSLPIRCDGCVPTLRANHDLTWVVLEGSHISRALHPIERLTLQGFHPEARGVTEGRGWALICRGEWIR